MSLRPVRQLLADILERIEGFTAGLDKVTFVGDTKTVDAVVRNLEVIGEAASRLPPDFRDRHSNIPWRQIVGLRNRIVHAYFDVDLEIVWAISRGELPKLTAAIRALQAGGSDSAPETS